MNKLKKNLIYIIILLIIPIVIATSSTNFIQNITSINSATLNSSSTNFENKISLSSISGNSSSSNYQTCTGFQCATLNNRPNFTNISDSTITQGNSININLSNFFQDIDKDNLIYTSTTNSILTISISNDIATITGDSAGTAQITFTADDLIETTDSNLITFTVTPITTTPQTQEGRGSGGPGGGGGGPSPGTSLYLDFNFNIGSDLIELKQGEFTSTEIRIENIAFKPITVSIYTDLPKYFSLSKSEIIIPQKESSTVTLYITTDESTPPGTYIGKVFLKANGVQKTIPIILQVSSKQSIIDVKLDIPSDQISLLPGQDLKSQLTITNKGEISQLNTITTFTIRDLNNNIILEKVKEILINDQISLTEIFKLPEFLQGNFILTASVQYQDKTTLSSQKFSISKEEKPQEYTPISTTYTIIGITIAALIIGSLIFLNHLRLKKLKKLKKQIKKPTNKKKSLKKAYQKGFISKATYKLSLKKLKRGKK